MTVGKIIQDGDKFGITFPGALLEQLGLNVGDEVQIDVVDNRIVAESMSQANHEERLSAIAQGLLQKRADVYKALAVGVDQPDV